jgi:putative ABC transport system permease protein
MAYVVSWQTHEIGIRMATGAQRSDVVLKKGLTLILAGTVAGLAVSGAVMRLASQIWGLNHGPWTFCVAATLVVIVGLTASLFPAHRTAQVDPVVSRHYE